MYLTIIPLTEYNADIDELRKVWCKKCTENGPKGKGRHSERMIFKIYHAYVDDVIIYSKPNEKCVTHLDGILKKLYETNKRVFTEKSKSLNPKKST